MTTVRIPTSLRAFSNNRGELTLDGATVGDVLKALERECPGIGPKLFDERGALKRYVNVFLNDEDVRFLKKLETPVSANDTVSLIPAIAGGAHAR